MATETQLLRADDEARQAALDTRRSFIVQAPAGSGKTELLIQRYLRLLATVDDPEEILAITFTRKAAAEMRLRVVAALQKAAAGIIPDAAHERITAAAAKAVIDRDAATGWQLMDNPARMRIQTLDALNASIARMLPLTAAGTGATVVDENEMNALYRDAAAATLDWLGEEDEFGRAAREVLMHVDGNTGVYIRQLAGMLGRRDQWLPFMRSGQLGDAEAAALRRQFDGNLERIVSTHLADLASLLPVSDPGLFELLQFAGEQLREAGQDDNPICGYRVRSERKRQPDTDAGDLPEWLAVAELLLTKGDDLRKTINKNQGFPPAEKGRKADMLALLESLADDDLFLRQLAATRALPPARYSDAQWSVLLALFRLLPLAAGELKRLSLARGLTDYTEIAIAAGEALGSADEPGDTALLLDYQVRHILVDEMQDTSLAQYRMLGALTGGWEAGDGRTLFCVGDPMQSIYRFRNAEVAEFLLARKDGIGNVRLEPLLLRRNFRSGEHLVAWFNRVFPGILAPRDEALNGAVRYSPAVPVEQRAGQGQCVVHPVFGSSSEAEADTGSALVQQLCAQHPDDSIAILVRSRTHLPALLRRLAAAGIRYQAIDIDRLTDLPEIIDILALTRSLAHPGDRLAWLALLRSPWAGLDWTDLHTLVSGAAGQTVPELLDDQQRIASLSPTGRERLQRFLPVLQRHLPASRSMTLAERVERAWFELGGPALLADQNAVENIYRFLGVLVRLEKAGSIPDPAELAEQLDAERISTNTVANVQVLTMHKSKGLQFDHVLLYGLGRPPANNQPSVLSWFDLPGGGEIDHKVISPIGRRDELERDPLHVFIENTGKAKDAYEKGRLLYVACTRARQSLHLVGNVGLKSDGEEFSQPRANSLLAMLWPAVEADYASAFEENPVREAGEDGVVFVEPALRRIVPEWTLPPVRTFGSTDTGERGTASEQQVSFDWVGSDARLAGTVVHRWLQRITEGRAQFDMALQEPGLATSRRWLLQLGANEAQLDAVAGRIATILRQVRDDPQATRLFNDNGASELALTGVVDGVVESIIIDRVFIDEAGEHWIVDYKTSSHQGGNLAGFLSAESERYRAQLQKYANIYREYAGAAVRCALYFPVLGRFIEVTVD